MYERTWGVQSCGTLTCITQCNNNQRPFIYFSVNLYLKYDKQKKKKTSTLLYFIYIYA